MLFNVGGHFYAIDDSCPHAGSSLIGCKLDGLRLACPSHGLKLSLEAVCMCSSGLAVRTPAVRVRDGRVFNKQVAMAQG